MFKNLTLGQITLFITIWVMLGVAFYITLIKWLPDSNFIIHVIFTGVIGVISYIVIKYFLDAVVFRKIKLIYKVISDVKKAPSGNESEIEYNTIDEVQQVVDKWAEYAQREQQALRSLENYRKNFVGNISHELKTPLFSIQGYLHTLLEGGMYDEKIYRRYLKRAVKNIDRLQAVVEDLEIISSLEMGHSDLQITKFDLKELCQEVVDDLLILAKKSKIRLMFKEGASKSFLVMADRERIRQVLNNLVVNSIRYGKEEGVTRISFYDMEPNVLIEVTDEGIGIEEEHLKHLFDRFYRVDPSRSRELGGSGLGLSIVKHIVEAHDQNINVRSSPGIGSTFGFTLKKA